MGFLVVRSNLRDLDRMLSHPYDVGLLVTSSPTPVGLLYVVQLDENDLWPTVREASIRNNE